MIPKGSNIYSKMLIEYTPMLASHIMTTIEIKTEQKKQGRKTCHLLPEKHTKTRYRCDF